MMTVQVQKAEEGTHKQLLVLSVPRLSSGLLCVQSENDLQYCLGEAEAAGAVAIENQRLGGRREGRSPSQAVTNSTLFHSQ